MTKQDVFILIAEAYIVYWWLCLAYSRHKTAKTRAIENTKYAIWDEAFNKALKEDKGQRHAMLEAVKAVRAKQAVINVWDDTYKQSINTGVRNYKAGATASAAAREAAHK